MAVLKTYVEMLIFLMKLFKLWREIGEGTVFTFLELFYIIRDRH